MADPPNNVGASNNNPNMATSQAESEGTANPSTTTVAGAGQVQGSQNPVPGPENTASDPVSAAFLGIVATLLSVKASLGTMLLAKQAGRVLGTSLVESLVGPTIVKMAKILQAYPAIKTTVDPVSLLARVSEVEAMQDAEDAVTDLLGKIQYTRKLLLAQTWKDTRTAYGTAVRDGAADDSLATALAPLASQFAKPKRTVTAAHTATVATLASIAASTRATASESRATAAQQRAKELVPQLTVTGTGDAVITQPAPQAPAPAPASSTTAPSATALAATPGTPGTSTIR